TQGHRHGDRRPRLARGRARRGRDLSGARRGIRAVARRQYRRSRHGSAPQAAALCRLPGDGAAAARDACGIRATTGGARAMIPPHEEADAACGYAFGYLDELTKRAIRRATLKAVAVPGYQVPFGSREMPMPPGWGTGGIQLTASLIGRGDVLKV